MLNQQVDFKKEVLEASKKVPVVVDFWAEWCAPCRMLGPVLEKLAAEANGRWKLVKINTDLQPDLAMQFHIQSIPAVKMFYDGEVIAEFIGALPEHMVRRWLEENLPSPSGNLLHEAEKALEAGDTRRAQEFLEELIKQEPENATAKVILAQLIFASDPARAARLVEGIGEEHPKYTIVESIRTLYRLLHDYEKLAQKASESAQDKEAWLYYLKGIQALQKHDYDEVLKNWIEALKINRQIDDDGPRKACVALFNLLGHDHEIVQKYHRSFTSVLF